MAAERARDADALVEEPAVPPDRSHAGAWPRRGEDCVTDGRGAFVVLTTNGLRAIKAAAPPHVASVRRHFVDLLTPEEIDTLATIANRVVDHLSEPATRRIAPA